jgi:hypothetical protein
MKEMMKEVGAVYFIGFFAPETSAQSSITIPNVSPSKLAVEAADKGSWHTGVGRRLPFQQTTFKR